MTRPRIAYLTSNDPTDRRSWSGTQYFMAQALQKHCGEVCFLGPISPPSVLFSKIWSKSLKLTTGRTYLYTHTVRLSKQIATIAQRKLSEQTFDLIFAPAGSTEIAHLDTELPIVYLSDATIALIQGYYPEFASILPFSLREAHQIEQLALNKASVVLYPSPWASRSALDDYHVDQTKVHVVPFGANLEAWPDRNLVLAQKPLQRCHLLFVGAEWERKGGEIAFKTMLNLEKKGLPTQLTVVGCVPPRAFSHENVRVIPFLDKNNPADSEKLSKLFLESDFFILPSRMECYGIVFCEANAFGLPVISTDTGGISGAVTHGENGYLLPMSAAANDYADLIMDLFLDGPRYLEMRTNCRRVFENKLNWDSWGKAVAKHMVGVQPYKRSSRISAGRLDHGSYLSH